MPSSLFALLDDHRHGARRRGVAHQGRHAEDRRRAGRRPGAQRPAGCRRQRKPRTAGRVGGGQGIRHQQGHPGAGGSRYQRPGALGGDSAADDRRRLSLLRGIREDCAQAASQRGGGRGARSRADACAHRSRGRPGSDRAGQDQGRCAHRLHTLGRDHRHYAGDGSERHIRNPGAGAERHRRHHDGGRLRPRRGHRQARRRRACTSASAAAKRRLPGCNAAWAALFLRAHPG